MLGIIGAMDEEVAKIKEHMTDVVVHSKASMDFYKGFLNGKEAVVVRSGIGKVNAAVCTQILIDDFQAEVVINTGIAGSLNADINIGDIVVSTDAVEHDMDVSALGDPVGQVPRMDTLAFPADERLIRLAKAANEKVNPDIHTFVGTVASGDQFIASQEAKDKIVNNFHAYCTEMEGAAIAHAAYLNKVSYVIIRAISDKADNSAHVDYPEFEKMAIARNIKLVQEMLTSM